MKLRTRRFQYIHETDTDLSLTLTIQNDDEERRILSLRHFHVLWPHFGTSSAIEGHHVHTQRSYETPQDCNAQK